MRLTKCLSLGFLALLLMVAGGCVLRPLPAAPAGVTLQPGRYLERYYRAPGFAPDQVSYTLGPFTVELAQGVAPDTFLPLLQTELARAWENNGLKLASRGEAYLLSGTVHQVSVRGTGLRFLFGKIAATLIVSGTIAKGDQTLFAFQDHLNVTSPTRSGRPAPKEVELLLRQATRDFTTHLLNELLLQGPDAEAG